MRHPLCTLASIDDLRVVPGVDRHAQACLRCQAETARDRRIMRELRGLRDVIEVAPAAVMASVEGRIRTTRPDARPAPGAALVPRVTAAGALAATAAAAVLLWRRSHAAV